MAEFNNSLGNIGSGGSIDQDNIFKSVFLSFTTVDGTPVIAQVANAINTLLPLTIVTEKQLLIFELNTVALNGNLTTYRYTPKNRGKGSYGIGGTPITKSNLQFLSVSETIVDDIENNPDSIIYTLGDISSTNISDYINSYTPSLPFQSVSDGGTLIKVVNNGNNEAYLFLSTSGLYGLNDLQTTPENFQLIPEDNTINLQGLQSVTTVGNSTTNRINVIDPGLYVSRIDSSSISVGDIVEASTIALSPTSLQYSNGVNENVVTLKSDQNTNIGNINFQFPIKVAGDYELSTTEDLNNYIPLTGTVTGNPVVGDIYLDDAVSIKAVDTGGGYYLGDVENAAINIPKGGVLSTGITITGHSSTRGLLGIEEFNYDGDRKAYVQKGYVDDAITTGGGAYIPLTQKGAVNGVVPLNSTSKIDALYLPSYVDDVLEFATLAAFPVTGETGKIYVALNTNKTYRWSGSAYIEISPSDVNSVAGLTGVITSAGLRTALSINNLDNTSDLNKPISTLTQTALNTKLSQGGNSFGTTLQVGSSDAQNVSIMRNNIPYLQLMSGDIIQTRDDMTFYGIAGPTFSSLKMGNASGTNSISIRRNRPDGVTTFAVDNQNASSTGNIMDFLSNSISVANFNKTGQLTIPNATADTHSVALGQLSTNSLSALTTLSLATTSRVMYYTYTGATTSIWTLPTIGTSVKVRYVLINTGSATVTINSNAGGNDIWDSGTLSNTTVLTPGSSMELFNNGNSFIIL